MKLAVITSGGDAPGMNATISSIFSAARINNIEVIFFKEGFKGIYENKKFESLDKLENISNLGGTILKSSRFNFKDKKIQDIAISNLKKEYISHLIVIGGDGSYRAAQEISTRIPTLFIPATIDNDIPYSIGFDTALNSAVKSIDNIRDSAISHNRNFLVEVMGNRCGQLTYFSHLAAAGTFSIVSELELDLELLIDRLNNNKYNVVLVSENVDVSNLMKKIEGRLKEGKELKKSVLGHTVRGGTPSARDRYLGKIYGITVVSDILSGKENCIVDISDKLNSIDLKYHRYMIK